MPEKRGIEMVAEGTNAADERPSALASGQDGSRPMRTSRQTTMDREIARRLENSWRRGSSSNPLPIVAIASRTPGPVAEARSASRAGDELGGREMTPAAVCTEAMRTPATHGCGSSLPATHGCGKVRKVLKDVPGNGLASGSTARAARKFAFNSLAELESWESERSGGKARWAANDDADLRDAAAMLLDAKNLSQKHHHKRGTSDSTSERKLLQSGISPARRKEATSFKSLYIGARLEVLFDNGGKHQWHEGRVTKKQGRQWQVRFEDGEEHAISWPDHSGEVRFLGCIDPEPCTERSDAESATRWDEKTLKYAAGLLLLAAAKSELMSR